VQVGSLTRGMDAFIKEIKKFDKSLQSRVTFTKLQDAMGGFKDSLPLIAMLKNDAVRDRHWCVV